MTTLVRWNPVRDAVALNRAMNRLFETPVVRTWPVNYGPRAFAVNVSEDDDNLVVEAALPGINPDQVDLSIEDNQLTIKGETSHEVKEGEESNDEAPKYYLRERFTGSFQRTFSLPVEVDADKAEANFENGLLTITLPKAEIAKRRQIPVSAS